MSIADRTTMLVSTLTLLTACSGQQTKLTSDDLRSLPAQPQIHAVHHLPERIFWIDSKEYAAAGAIFSPLVVISQMQESRTLQGDLRLADPAPRVKDHLTARFQQHFGLKNVLAVPDSPKNDTVETLKEVFRTGAVLDVRTKTWGIDNNRAKYSARVRLVRLADSTVLWEATCDAFVVDKDKPSPTREALTANHGELLKSKLLEAADGCAGQLWAWAATR
jgi:hypothetical protein